MNLLIDRIASLLEASVQKPRGIRAIVKGENLALPNASLPALVISPESVDIEMDDNVTDQHLSRIAIALVFDARQFLGASENTATGLYELAKIMQEEDANGLKNDTVLSVLRKELFYDSDYCQQVNDVRIDYGIGDRTFPTLEAVITFTVHGKPYIRNS